jgi:two-component system response regulator FixJ
MPGKGHGAEAADGTAGSVHIIDDDSQLCWALSTLVASAGLNPTVHPSASSFLDSVAAGSRLEAGCILTDLRMPGLNGLELLRRLRESGRRWPVIVMTAHGDVRIAVAAMRLGAFDFVEKPFDGEALLAILRTALASPAEVPVRLGEPEARARVAALSPREREVLRMAMDGMPSRIIARELGLSPRTIEVHRARLMTRLGVESLAAAIRIAVLAGMGTEDREPPAGGGGLC